MRENLTDLSESKYFDYLIEKQIRLKISDLIRQQKWIIITIGFIVALFFGYNIYNIYGLNQKHVEIASQSKKLQSEMENYKNQWQDILDQSTIQFDNLSNKINLVNDFFKNLKSDRAVQEDFYKENRDFLKNQLKAISSESNRIFSRNEDLKNSLSSLKEINLKKLSELSNIKNDLEKKLEDLERTLQKTRTVASVKYLFVERGDRNLGEWEYRPSFIDLPFSNYKLTVIFYQQKKYSKKTLIKETNKTIKLTVKEATVDIILEDINGSEKPRKATLVFKEQSPQPIFDTNYYLEALFIYLPPNPFVRIPDFVIFKVSRKNYEV